MIITLGSHRFSPSTLDRGQSPNSIERREADYEYGGQEFEISSGAPSNLLR